MIERLSDNIISALNPIKFNSFIIVHNNIGHLIQISPFVSPLVIAFDMIDGGDSVEPSDSEDHVIDDLDGEVAPRVVHVWHRRPGVGVGIEYLPAAHPRYPVESSNHVDLTSACVY